MRVGGDRCGDCVVHPQAAAGLGQHRSERDGGEGSDREDSLGTTTVEAVPGGCGAHRRRPDTRGRGWGEQRSRDPQLGGGRRPGQDPSGVPGGPVSCPGPRRTAGRPAGAEHPVEERPTGPETASGRTGRSWQRPAHRLPEPVDPTRAGAPEDRVGSLRIRPADVPSRGWPGSVRATDLPLRCIHAVRAETAVVGAVVIQGERVEGQ